MLAKQARGDRVAPNVANQIGISVLAFEARSPPRVHSGLTGSVRWFLLNFHKKHHLDTIGLPFIFATYMLYVFHMFSA